MWYQVQKIYSIQGPFSVVYAYAYFSPNLTKPRKILFVKVYKVRLQDFRGFWPFCLHFTQPMSAVCPQNWAISYHFECCHSILHQTSHPKWDVPCATVIWPHVAKCMMWLLFQNLCKTIAMAIMWQFLLVVTNASMWKIRILNGNFMWKNIPLMLSQSNCHH